MANQKPLPELPTSLPLPTLSVEAQNHRARLIKHFLTDIHEPGIENRLDGWVYVLEEALDALGQQFSQGDWLSSIKRRRELRIHKQLPRTQRDDGKKSDATAETTHSRDDKPLPAKPEAPVSPLKQLRTIAARPAVPQGQQRIGHLLLCVSPHGSQIPLPTEDSGFDILPANIGCVFSAGSFALQDRGQDELDGTVLYGLEGLETNAVDDNLRLVGGTFTFKGVNSPMQHHLLCEVLRLAVYVYLSLMLEQRLLSDSGVHLKLARPKFPVPSPSTPTRLFSDDISQEKEPIKETSRGKALRNSIIPSSFTNFFLKRNFSHRRSQTINPPAGHNGLSLNLTVFPSSPDVPAEAIPRRSVEGLSGAVAGRLRRFSFMGDRHASLWKSSPHPAPVVTESAYRPFSFALKRIDDSRSLLSTSAGITLALPKLIVDLAEKEKTRTSQTDGEGVSKKRLKGDERAALTSLLGWDGKDAEGRGMAGILGFVRHQEISVLCSSHVPSSSSSFSTKSQTTAPPAASAPSISLTPSIDTNVNNQEGSSASTTALVPIPPSSATASNLPQSDLSPCGKPHWITYQYYSQRPGGDFILGDWARDLSTRRTMPCDRSGCTFSQGQHEQRIIHDGVRIAIRVAEEKGKGKEKEEETKEASNESESEDEGIEIWESCAVCDAKTTRTKMNDGTYLFSFAKFLELLIYSPSICTLTPPLCEHTTPPPGVWPTLPSSRLNIIRHFSTSSADISLALSTIEDIFELRVPRLQIMRGVERCSQPSTSSGNTAEGQGGSDDEQKKVLRREIRKWWEGVSDHMDKIEQVLNADVPNQKSLPRLPSIDDAYDAFGTPGPVSGTSTPRASNTLTLPSLPSSTPTSPSNEVHPPQDSYFTTQSSVSTDTQASKTPTVPPKDNPVELLAALRHNFQKIEQSLYTLLAKTPEGSLNDVRRAFLATGKGTQKRLKAWQKKHLHAAQLKTVGELVAEEPQWWGKGYHVVPGGNIIVREDDWGSIIAHTLSTADYQLELASLSMARSGSASQAATTPVIESAPSSFFSVATGYKLFTSSSKHQPDPDQEDVVWNEPETYSATISRKEHTRDPTSLLSIRDVLRQKTIPEPPNVLLSAHGSRFSTLSSANAAHVTATPKPPSVKTTADVGLSMQAAGGQLNASPDSVENVDLLRLQLENGVPFSTPSSRPASIKSEAISKSNSGIAETNIRRGRTSSVISAESEKSQSTVGKEIVPNADTNEPPGQPSQLPPALPPKDAPKIANKENVAFPSTSTAPSAWNANTNPGTPDVPPSTSSGFASTLASGISSAMRFVLNSEPPSRSASPSAANAKKHHVLLADMANFDERPHIKYDWTIGKRLKFSCTVYYAKQFDVLRKRCGIQDTFVKSLSRSTNWAAVGGKSKSNFWKTSDDRFIIKTLVNAWNVADLQVLVELAPSYFRYMDATASKATVLAKLIGFYTIEIRNLETGAVQSKADLLVMENLFFNQNISKTFDLKGIQGRRVKTQGDRTKTLFDGEWIEGQQRTLTLVRPYSKVILREAIKSDAEFLSKSNIMDYSLLLGIDEEKKEIACGLVDTIGSYTFAKTIEYKAKQGLQSGKEVTVMPPTEYQERFVSALEGYFVACPDKWSKPLDDSRIISDPNLLPSVL
ncbi:hypothetical protein BDZ97DRAFT_1902851 [Flammula alnicola]|nr:hypothetical protein BDZ97DRAFT_1902851 [Flammula alnicola]